MTEEPRTRDQKVIEEFRANAGVVGGTYAQVPLLLLHHTGASSGAARITPLAYIADGQNWVIFAANSGGPTHPGWYHNLCRNPAAAVELAPGTFEVTARIAQGTEREDFLDRFRQSSPYFAGFEKATHREIPVVVLERTQP